LFDLRGISLTRASRDTGAFIFEAFSRFPRLRGLGHTRLIPMIAPDKVYPGRPERERTGHRQGNLPVADDPHNRLEATQPDHASFVETTPPFILGSERAGTATPTGQRTRDSRDLARGSILTLSF
jgi:hypothetical protein